MTQKDSDTTKGTLVIIGFIVLMIIVFSHVSGGGDSNASGSSSDSCVTGNVTRVGKPDVTFAVTRDDFDAATSAAAANDREGFAQLYDTGQIFNLPKGTKLRVLDMGFIHADKFRVLSTSSYYYDAIIYGSCDSL
jgi:hypothetical protein